MDSQAMWHQAHLEREQMLLEALKKAEAGIVNPDDWNTIRFECGLQTVEAREVKFNDNLGDKHEFSSYWK